MRLPRVSSREGSGHASFHSRLGDSFAPVVAPFACFEIRNRFGQTLHRFVAAGARTPRRAADEACRQLCARARAGPYVREISRRRCRARALFALRKPRHSSMQRVFPDKRKRTKAAVRMRAAHTSRHHLTLDGARLLVTQAERRP